jgi:transposase
MPVPFVAALRQGSLGAPMVLDGPMTGQAFLAYVEQVLIPTLRTDDIVVLDNLPAHKIAAVRAAIARAGAQFFLLPPYSPDMNPIEMAFAKLKTLLRQAPERPATVCGAASVPCSTISPQTNAPITSKPQAMEIQCENALVFSY